MTVLKSNGQRYLDDNKSVLWRFAWSIVHPGPSPMSRMRQAHKLAQILRGENVPLRSSSEETFGRRVYWKRTREKQASSGLRYHCVDLGWNPRYLNLWQRSNTIVRARWLFIWGHCSRALLVADNGRLRTDEFQRSNRTHRQWYTLRCCTITNNPIALNCNNRTTVLCFQSQMYMLLSLYSVTFDLTKLGARWVEEIDYFPSMWTQHMWQNTMRPEEE